LLLKVCVLLLLITISGFSAAQVRNTPTTVEQSEKKLAKQATERRKKDAKARKIAQKNYWSKLSKRARKTVKQSNRRALKRAKQLH